MSFSRELEVARTLARRAGAAIMQHYAADFAVEYKDAGGSDPVTQADRDANSLIVAGLAEAFPDDGILAEESPPNRERLSRKRLWCVDPLDGTREFVDRNGQFVVMIGLAIDGGAVLGVVYQPTENIMWWGSVGDGAFEESAGQPPHSLHVTERSESAGATLMVSRSHRSNTVTRVAQSLGIDRELPLGSVGLKVARLATGNADVYISCSNRTQEWDACGPEAILRAAGGQMTDVCGRPLVYNKPSTETPFGMLATNGVLHAACVEALQPVATERGWLKAAP